MNSRVVLITDYCDLYGCMRQNKASNDILMQARSRVGRTGGAKGAPVTRLIGLLVETIFF